MSKKICFFGGSFDPIHKGHLMMALAAHEHMGFKEVLFCPVKCSPHKNDTMFPFKARLDMIDEAIEQMGFESWAKVCQIECHNESSYTSELIGIIREQFGIVDEKIYWLIGADQYVNLKSWHDFDFLNKNLHFCVYNRSELHIDESLVEDVTIINGEDFEISSSLIRNLIDTGKKLPCDLTLPCYQRFIKDLEICSFVNFMKERGVTIATAESCTAGNIAGEIAKGYGASDVLKCGFVTYSNEAKIEILGVKKETIERHGVVSYEVAKEMAERARELTKTTLTISITGYTEPLCAFIGISHESGAVVYKVVEATVSHSRNVNRQNLVELSLILAKNFIKNVH